MDKNFWWKHMKYMAYLYLFSAATFGASFIIFIYYLFNRNDKNVVTPLVIMFWTWLAAVLAAEYIQHMRVIP